MRVIRLFGLCDILTMKQLCAHSVSLDLRRTVLDQPDPLRAALLGYLTRHHFGPLTYIFQEDAGRTAVQGFAQVWPGPGRGDWILGDFAPAPDTPEADSVWSALLTGLMRQAAERARPRILAQVAEGSEEERRLHNHGFVAVVREELFRLTHRLEPASSPPELLPAGPQDAWAIGELYRQVVPRYVREAHTSVGDGCTTAGAQLFAAKIAEDHVWLDEGHANAYFALSVAPHGLWMDLLVRPELRAEIAPHVRHILSRFDISPQQPAYCSVPDYAVGIGWLLRTLGFESVHRHVRMVMHVAARLPLRRSVIVSGLEPGVDIRTPVGTVQGCCVGPEDIACT